MTREEHIYQLIQYLQGRLISMCPASSLYWKEHYEEIIKGLEQEPTKNDDCISKKYIYSRIKGMDHYEESEGSEGDGTLITYNTCDWNEVLREIEDAPTVTPQPTKNDLGVDCISRAEAIRVASGYCHPSNVAKELAKLPSITPQDSTTKNDLGVEEVTALAEWITKLTEANKSAYSQGYADGMKAQAEPKTGHWIAVEMEKYSDTYGHFTTHEFKCSNCGGNYIFNYHKYCPNCGAKMAEMEAE